MVPRPDFPAIALKIQMQKTHVDGRTRFIAKQVTAGISFEDARITSGASKLSTPCQEDSLFFIQGVSSAKFKLYLLCHPHRHGLFLSLDISHTPSTTYLIITNLLRHRHVVTTKRPLKALASRFFYTLPLTRTLRHSVTSLEISLTTAPITAVAYSATASLISFFAPLCFLVIALSWISFAESLGSGSDGSKALYPLRAAARAASTATSQMRGHGVESVSLLEGVP